MNTAEVLTDPATCDEGSADDATAGPLPLDAGDTTDEPAVPAPVLAARGLGHHTSRAVFGRFDLEVYPGELVVLTGAPGSGRTAALLSLTGNFRHRYGVVVRARTALGLVPGVHEPEPMLTAREHLDERLRLLRPIGLPTRARRVRHKHALDQAGRRLPFDVTTKAGELTPIDRHRLMIELALLADPAVIAVDDADLGLTFDEQRDLAAALRATGRAVVLTAREATSYAPDQIVEITR
ncbi:ATP-binding cassette domain-containing protein [Hamadaea sp. NPDC051192]|uniref:ATP-binding cassette domain-containing protein n=1 Tax=Hamadaea sp. NPDC051192 TaxID=3154940 RepID=UPI00341A9240